MPPSSINPSMNNTVYITVKLPREVWNELLEVLDIAYESSQELLVNHDTLLGRTTIKNKRHAEMLEQDKVRIGDIKFALKEKLNL